MDERARPTAAAVAAPGVAWTVERRDLLLVTVATLAAWAHTVDEIRIGEFVALPFGVANVAMVMAWPRLRSRWRAVGAIAFGLFWAVAVIPYHVVPLLEGAMTAQNISGLSRLAVGGAMVAVGVAILLRRTAR